MMLPPSMPFLKLRMMVSTTDYLVLQCPFSSPIHCTSTGLTTTLCKSFVKRTQFFPCFGHHTMLNCHCLHLYATPTQFFSSFPPLILSCLLLQLARFNFSISHEVPFTAESILCSLASPTLLNFCASLLL